MEASVVRCPYQRGRMVEGAAEGRRPRTESVRSENCGLEGGVCRDPETYRGGGEVHHVESVSESGVPSFDCDRCRSGQLSHGLLCRSDRGCMSENGCKREATQSDRGDMHLFRFYELSKR